MTDTWGLSSDRTILIHADERCLRNGMEPPNPGGASCLIESRGTDGVVVRRDLYISAPNTTNNRMALSGAIAGLALLGRVGAIDLTYVSDSEYLVKGITEWVPGWEARGWRRKTGEILNLALWKKLRALSDDHQITWRWVRGHADHPKNEYADWLANTAAQDQTHSTELEDSRFEDWLQGQRQRGKYREYDADDEV